MSDNDTKLSFRGSRVVRESQNNEQRSGANGDTRRREPDADRNRSYDSDRDSRGRDPDSDNNRSYGTSNSSDLQRNNGGWGGGRGADVETVGVGVKAAGVAVGAVSEDVTNIRYPSGFGTFGGGTATKTVTAIY